MTLAAVFAAAGIASPATAEPIAQGLRPLDECRIDTRDGDDFGEGFPRPASSASSIGTLTVQVLFVDFPDHPGGAPDEVSIPLTLAQLPSLSERFENLSSGRLEVVIRADAEWRRLPAESTAYPAGESGAFPHDVSDRFVSDAISAADAAVDFGGVDVTWVVYPSTASTASRAAAWNSYTFDADGVRIARAVTIPSLGSDDLLTPTMLHETGHTLGLPDLYDYAIADRGPGFSSVYVGDWDPMGDSSVGLDRDLLGWHSWALGWLDDDSVACIDPNATTEIRLSRLDRRSGTAIAVVKTDLWETFVIESRRPGGLDTYLAQPGALVYSVRDNVAGGAGPVRVLPPEGHSQPTDREGLASLSLQTGQRAGWATPHYIDPPIRFTVTVIASDDEGDTVRFAPVEPTDGSGGGGGEPAPAPPAAPLTPEPAPYVSAAVLPATGSSSIAEWALAAFLLAVGGVLAGWAAQPRRRAR